MSKSFGDWGLTVERSGTHQRGLPDGRQWLVTANHALTPRFVLDFGAARHGQGSETDHTLSEQNAPPVYGKATIEHRF